MSNKNNKRVLSDSDLTIDEDALSFKKSRITSPILNCLPLPDDILGLIWSFLSLTELKSIRLICNQWNSLILDRFASRLKYEIRYLEIECLANNTLHVVLRKTGYVWEIDPPEPGFKCRLDSLYAVLQRIRITKPVPKTHAAQTWCVLNLMAGNETTAQRILDDFSNCNLMPDSLHIFGNAEVQLDFLPAITRYHLNKRWSSPPGQHKLFLRMIGNADTPPIVFYDAILASHLTALLPIGSVRLCFTLEAVQAWLHEGSPHSRELTIAVDRKAAGNWTTLNENDIVQLGLALKTMATETKPGGKRDYWQSSYVRLTFEGVIFECESWKTAIAALRRMFRDKAKTNAYRDEYEVPIEAKIGKLQLRLQFRKGLGMGAFEERHLNGSC